MAVGHSSPCGRKRSVLVKPCQCELDSRAISLTDDRANWYVAEGGNYDFVSFRRVLLILFLCVQSA